MSGVEIKQVVPKGMVIGEGPHWVKERHCLLFVDIKNSELHRLFTETGRHQVLRIDPGESGDTVSFIIPVDKNPDLFAIGHGRSISLVDWPESDPDCHSKQVKVTLHTVEGERPKNRFNDAKCDPQGRLWAGTMGAESAPGVLLENDVSNLYRLDPDLTLECCVDKIALSNGLAWSADRKTFYYIDSLAYSVDAFDYDDITGKIGNRRQVLDFKVAGLDKDVPDGMCVDTNGDLWVACFNGAKVIRIHPATRTITHTLTLPARYITSVCWGGPDLATLFVTSASIGLTPSEIESQSAGATFAVTGLGVTGVPPSAFKIDPLVLKQKLG